MNKSLQEKIDTLFQMYDQKGSPGCAIGIVQHGEFLFKKGYGMANLEYDIPITPRSVFCLASLAKQFTGMCIWLLEEEKHLSLQDNIRLYLPEFPDYGETITIANLLYHTSGIRDYYVQAIGMMGVKLHDFLTQEEVLQLIIEQKRLIFTPGTRFHYSNTNYVLLSLIIQRLSGMSIGQFSQKYIFEPLGMKHTFYREDHSRLIKNRAVAYGDYPLQNGTPNQRAAPQEGERHYILTSDSELTGDDGVWSTIEDLYLWSQNLSLNRLGQGRQELIEAYLTPGCLSNGLRTGYASGLCIGTLNGRPVIEHKGWINGYLAVLEYFPQEQTAIFILSNTCYLIPWEFTSSVGDFLFENSLQSERSPESIANEIQRQEQEIDEDTIARVTGKYIHPESTNVWNISYTNGHLKLCINESDEIDLFVRQKDVLGTTQADWHIQLIRNSKGEKLHLVFTTGESKQTFLPFFSGNLTNDEGYAYVGTYVCEELRTTFDILIEREKLFLRNQNRHRCGLNLFFERAVGDLFYAHDPSVDCIVIEFQRDLNQMVQAFVFRSSSGDGREQLRFCKQ